MLLEHLKTGGGWKADAEGAVRRMTLEFREGKSLEVTLVAETTGMFGFGTTKYRLQQLQIFPGGELLNGLQTLGEARRFLRKQADLEMEVAFERLQVDLGMEEETRFSGGALDQ